MPNTDNKLMNLVLLPVLLPVFLYLAFGGYLPLLAGDSLMIWISALSFAVSYAFSSYWFSPDLDCASLSGDGRGGGVLSSNIPGKGSFPFKPLIKLLYLLKLNRLARLLDAPHRALNRLWRALWLPFGALFTHRGVLHWPLIGAGLRLWYLHLVFYVLTAPLALALGLFPFLSYAGSLATVAALLCFTAPGLSLLLGVVLSDLFHSGVDLSDSIRNGTRFCSFRHERGLIAQMLGRKGSKPKPNHHHQRGRR